MYYKSLLDTCIALRGRTLQPFMHSVGKIEEASGGFLVHMLTALKTLKIAVDYSMQKMRCYVKVDIFTVKYSSDFVFELAMILNCFFPYKHWVSHTTNSVTTSTSLQQVGLFVLKSLTEMLISSVNTSTLLQGAVLFPSICSF